MQHFAIKQQSIRLLYLYLTKSFLGENQIFHLLFLESPDHNIINYDNYVFDLKRVMQETHKMARDNL